MGTRPKRPCRYPGCPELVAPGEGYCERHKAEMQRIREWYAYRLGRRRYREGQEAKRQYQLRELDAKGARP